MNSPLPLPPGIPSVIRVGAFDIELLAFSNAAIAEKESFGEFSAVGLCIRIDPRIHPIKFVDTFYHELMHAIYWAYHIEDEDKEERTVSMMSSALVDFHRNNPRLSHLLIDLAETGKFYESK